MKLLFTGGGTGGHIYPALAIASAYQKKHPDAEIGFVGTPWGLEAELIPRAGYPFHTLPIRGIRRSLSPTNLRSLWLLLRSSSRAGHILQAEKPSIVIGTGGYVCYPLVRAAQRAGIPTLLHESNAIPGLAIKRLAADATMVFTNFADTAHFLSDLPKERILQVGNPLRPDFAAFDREKARRELRLTGRYRRLVLAVGGSLGAERLNDAVARVFSALALRHPDWLFCHATGKRDFERMKAIYASLGRSIHAECHPYFDDLPLRMSGADLILSRAGAMTLSEIAALGLPSILIPSPYVANDHQRKNADVFVKNGASLLFEEGDLDTLALEKAIEKTLSSPPSLRKMGTAARRLFGGDAAGRIADEIDRILTKKAEV